MLDITVKIRLFKSLLLPHFLYGAIFLLNASARSLGRQRVALNCCVRYVFSLSMYSRVTHLQKQLLGCSFNNFLKAQSCIVLFKIISSSTPSYLHEKLQPFRSSRARNYLLPRHFTAHYRSTLFVQGITYWNSLPNEIRNNVSLTGFRRDLYTWLNAERQQN